MSKFYNISVLFIEDEQNIVDVVSMRLKKILKNFKIFKTPKDALDCFRKERFDIVLTDIFLDDDLDGLDLIWQMKTLNKSVKFGVITAQSNSTVLLKAININVDKYFLKPMSFEAIFEFFDEVDRQKMIEEEVLEKRRLAHEYLHAIDASAIVSKADVRGVITYVNDKFCEISGYSREELIGKPHSIVRHQATPSVLFENMWREILDKKIWQGRITNRKKDGHRYIVETTITPILDSSGEISEFISIREDVTKYIEIGRELRKKDEERKEQERLHLEELNSSKDRLLSLFTHELKTPLNAIINLSSLGGELLGAKDINRDEIDIVIEYLELISQNGSFMLQQITNILDIVKIKSNKFTPLISSFSLLSLVNKSLASYKDREKKIDINIICEDESRNIRSDEGRVLMMIKNLLSNAIKYAKSEVLITLKFSNESFVLSIEDDGSGFGDKKRAISLFAQDDESLLKRDSSGIGLGLHFVALSSKALDMEFLIDDSTTLGGAMALLSGEI